MKSLVCGVGVNEGVYPTRVDGKRVKEYNLWVSMLERCYNHVFQSKNTTYIGCSVSDNFLSYSYFYEWCHKQIGFGNQGWQLDKDIMFKGNKVYSEDNCAFVPRSINSFFNANGNVRGEHPVGVYFDKRASKYKAKCTVDGKTKHLGYFNTPQEALLVYKPFKEALCKELALKHQHELDPRIFNAMMEWVLTESY